MTQRPLEPSRIIRIPVNNPFRPSPAKLDGSNPRPVPEGCPRCGCYVSDRTVHAGFHAELDKLSRWAQVVHKWSQSVQQLLALLTRGRPDLGAVPTFDDTPTTGETPTTDGKGPENA